jgi:hypothetical protein
MITFLLVVVAILAVGVLLLFGSMVELYRQMLQLREHVGMVDRAQSLKFNPTIMFSDLPVPLAMLDLQRAALLILSDSCTTCYKIAEHMRGVVPDGVAILVEARSTEDARVWCKSHDLNDSNLVILDEDGLIARRLGISVTPAFLRFENQYPLSAITVPSTRQFDRVVAWILGDTESSDETGMVFKGATP